MTGLRRTAGLGFVSLALLLGSGGCYSRVNNGQGLEPSLGVTVANSSTDAIRVWRTKGRIARSSAWLKLDRRGACDSVRPKGRGPAPCAVCW